MCEGIEEGHGGALVGGLDRDEIPRKTVAAAERDQWDMSLDFRVGLYIASGFLGRGLIGPSDLDRAVEKNRLGKPK